MTIWIPIVLIAYTAQGYLSAHTGRYIWLVIWLLGALPLWAVISRYSTAIVRDAIIFDVLMLVGFQLGLVLHGAYSGMTWGQYLGIGMCLIGLMIYVIGGK